jgi:Flp pilus assembly CpaF family ATPase
MNEHRRLSPSDLPSWAYPAGVQSAPSESSVPAGPLDGPTVAGSGGTAEAVSPSDGAARGADFEAVRELRSRVSTRATAEGGDRYQALDAAAQRLRKRSLALEELQSWTLHRANIGLPALSVEDEDVLIEAVLAGLGGLGRLEPLLLRPDVEDIFFHGTAPTMLRLADGRKVEGEPLAASDEELRTLLQQLGTSLGDGSSREFSDARPLLALRLRAVGDLGARLSAATDVTPHPAGTIRIHRHAEADLDDAYALRMIDAPLRAFLRAAVLAGLKIGVVGAMGHGKTFLLRSLCAEIPLDKMIVTVEDERELGLHVLPARDEHGTVRRAPDGGVIPRRHPSLVRAYEARPANSEGSGRIDQSDLLYHALRDSADVLVLGESRGGEIIHFLDAATNGTQGVMGTWHANSAGEVFDRIVQMVLKAHPPLPTEWALRAATALDLVVFVHRNRAHERFVSEVLEVHSGQLGERGVPVVSHLFGPREDGRAVPTGHRPSARVLALLEEVGFSAQWLQPSLSDWDRPAAEDSTSRRAAS